jgi:hypothetical protein
MTEDQRLHLIEAMYHLEMIEVHTMSGLGEAEDRAAAALYLVQRAVNGHVPPNWDEVMEKVRGVDALNALAEIQESSKKGQA